MFGVHVSKCLDHADWLGTGFKTNTTLRQCKRIRQKKKKSQEHIKSYSKKKSSTEAAWEAETRLSGINMWKVKYQLALHLRGQYHYPLTGKAEKTHSSSGIIKLSQWGYKVSSSLSWWHSSAIWERHQFAPWVWQLLWPHTVRSNSSRELQWLKACVVMSSIMSSYSSYWMAYTRSPGHWK